MYGVVEIKGHQYRVKPGDLVDVQKIEGEPGAELTLDQVLFIGGKEPLVGAPVVEGAKVHAKIVKHDRSRKIQIYRRGVGKWRRSNGHRQHFSCLEITSIEDGKGNTEKATAKKAEKKTTKKAEKKA